MTFAGGQSGHSRRTSWTVLAEGISYSFEIEYCTLDGYQSCQIVERNTKGWGQLLEDFIHFILRQ